MTAPQLEYYAAERASRTAIIHTATGTIAAWVERDGDVLHARLGPWRSEPAETIPQLVRLVSQRDERAARRRPPASPRP